MGEASTFLRNLGSESAAKVSSDIVCVGFLESEFCWINVGVVRFFKHSVMATQAGARDGGSRSCNQRQKELPHYPVYSSELWCGREKATTRNCKKQLKRWLELWQSARNTTPSFVQKVSEKMKAEMGCLILEIKGPLRL